MSESPAVTRERLRKYLIPDGPNGLNERDADGDRFPRSKVMRFAFDPRNRRLLMFSGSILAVLVTRAFGTGKLSMAADLARAFTRNKS